MTTLTGRTALVTGAASGIGRLLAGELAARGARLVLWDLDETGLAGAAAELRAHGADVAAYRCDVANRHEVYAVAPRVLAAGPVDVLVNNAGIVSGRPLLEIPDERIEATFAVNTLALYWTTKAFLPGMLDRGTGHVVTVASAAGLVGVARQSDYAASKHAAVGFDESLRAELRVSGRGIKTTVVCPFYVATGMFEGVRSRFPLLLPILAPAAVAARIAGAIERDEPRVLLPPLVRLVPVLRALPVRWFDRIADLLGVNSSMAGFTGRP